MNRGFFTLPNLMTLYRFPAGPAALWLLLQMNPANYPQLHGGYPAWISVLGMIIAMLVFLTDFYDGRLARRYNNVTNFGKMADPIADSLFFTLFLLGLTLSPRFQVSVWFTVIMIYREAGVQVIRRIAALNGVVLMAGLAGKLKMLLQGVAAGILSLAIMLKDLGQLNISENTLITLAWITAAAAAFCGILSLAAYVKQLPAMLQKSNECANRETQAAAAPK